MNTALKLCAALLGVMTLSGCMGYSQFVNAHAPGKQKHDLLGRLPESALNAESPFCEPPPVREVYMVMPEEGKTGVVSVTFNDGKELTLSGDYSAAALAGDEATAYVSNQEEMRATFGEAIAHIPPPPANAILYFVFGKDELIPESRLEAERIYNDFVKRQAPEILLVGHTDTVGPEDKNQLLSIKRAEKVRQNLVEMGIPIENIQVLGRGELELLVPTPDNTKELKNRRVEINVR